KCVLLLVLSAVRIAPLPTQIASGFLQPVAPVKLLPKPRVTLSMNASPLSPDGSQSVSRRVSDVLIEISVPGNGRTVKLPRTPPADEPPAPSTTFCSSEKCPER